MITKEKRIEKINARVEILTPIHIGDGLDLDPLEYVITQNLYRIDLGTYLSSIPYEKKKSFEALLKAGTSERLQLINIRRFIKDNFSSATPYLWNADVSLTVKKIYEERFEDIENQLLISPFARSADRPFLPGSSIKGVIRTALLNYWSKDVIKPKNPERSEEVEGEILNALDLKPPRYGGDRPVYKYNIDKDIFRALRVEDLVLPTDGTFFAKVSNFNIKDGNLNETTIQMAKEITRFKLADTKLSSLSLSICLDQRFLKHSRSYLGRRDITIETILSSCDKFYRRVLRDEKKRMFEGKNKEISEVYDSIDQISEDSYLFRVGWGSGFDAMTITKFRHPLKWGTSKHLVEGKWPLGFMKLTY
jgi:CRISPR-associated protein Csm5